MRRVIQAVPNTVFFGVLAVLLLCCISSIVMAFSSSDDTVEPAPAETPKEPNVAGSTPSAAQPVEKTDCNDPVEERSCADYNVAFSGGKKYVCPTNYTLLDSYAPGGIKTPVCHMNNGERGTPKTCETYKDPGCNAAEFNIPCYGNWPTNDFKVRSYYDKWQVTDAMPADKVCK